MIKDFKHMINHGVQADDQPPFSIEIAHQLLVDRGEILRASDVSNRGSSWDWLGVIIHIHEGKIKQPDWIKDILTEWADKPIYKEDQPTGNDLATFQNCVDLKFYPNEGPHGKGIRVKIDVWAGDMVYGERKYIKAYVSYTITKVPAKLDQMLYAMLLFDAVQEWEEKEEKKKQVEIAKIVAQRYKRAENKVTSG